LSLPVVSECNCEDKPMTIKGVLLSLTSYPTPTQKQAIENAVAVARAATCAYGGERVPGQEGMPSYYSQPRRRFGGSTNQW
jgi:hypothetical protein